MPPRTLTVEVLTPLEPRLLIRTSRPRGTVRVSRVGRRYGFFRQTCLPAAESAITHNVRVATALYGWNVNRGRPALLLVGGALVVSVVAIALGLTARERAGGPSLPVNGVVDSAHAVPADIRTVLVSKVMPEPSEPGMRLHVQLRNGTMPTRGAPAEVLTDEDCAPDASGMSRCRNVLRLKDGRTMVVRHPHDMRQVPCLTPGEHVFVRAAS